MTRALLLENPHSIADDIFAKFGIEVTRVTGALSEDDLIDALDGVDYLGLRSKTEVTERVLRAPQTGIFLSRHDIGDHVKAGDVVATVEANGVSKEIRTVISGVIRGLLRSGTPVTDRIKVGDVDPRDNTACHHVSDKAFAIGGGILEAILGRFNRPCYIRRGILHCPVDKNVPTA